jgi:hypothetical protein
MANATILASPIAEGSQISARFSFAAATTFLILLAVLHVIKPEIPPSWNFISEYETGNFGWVMRVAFFSLGLSCIALFIAIRSQIRTIGGYFGQALLLISAVGLFMGGIFTTDPLGTSKDALTTHGNLHQFGAMLDSIPFAALLISWSLARKNQAWSSARCVLFWAAGLPLLGTVVFIVSMVMMFPRDGQFGPSVLLGWPNRFMIVTHCVSLMILAWRTIRLSKPQPAS